MSLVSNVEKVDTFHDFEHCPTCIDIREQEHNAWEDEINDGEDDDDSLEGACLCHDSFSCPDDGFVEYMGEDGLW